MKALKVFLFSALLFASYNSSNAGHHHEFFGAGWHILGHAFGLYHHYDPHYYYPHHYSHYYGHGC